MAHRSLSRLRTVKPTRAIDCAYFLLAVAFLLTAAPVSAADPRTDLITRSYESILGREPDPGGLRAYLQSGLDENGIRASLLNSDECRIQMPTFACINRWATTSAAPHTDPRVDMIDRVYREVLGRDADPGGIDNYLRSGLDESGTRTSLLNSNECRLQMPTFACLNRWGAASVPSTGSGAQSQQPTSSSGNPLQCAGAQLSFPFPDGYIGWLWKEPNTDNGGDHAGIDVWGNGGYGAPVYAPGPGRVNRVNSAGFDVLDDSTGLEYYIAMLHDMQVREGDRVAAGQLLGLQGVNNQNPADRLHVHISVGPPGYSDLNPRQTRDPSSYFGGPGADLSWAWSGQEHRDWPLAMWCGLGPSQGR